MVISRAIRPKKNTLKSVVEVGTRYKKVSTRDKLLKILEKHKNGLILTDLAFEANVRSCGNVSQVLKFLIRSKEVIKEPCPHCGHIDLYKLNI